MSKHFIEELLDLFVEVNENLEEMVKQEQKEQMDDTDSNEVEDFMKSFDATKWAAYFKKLNSASDESTMLGWFASALMRGYDERGWRINERLEELIESYKNIYCDEYTRGLINGLILSQFVITGNIPQYVKASEVVKVNVFDNSKVEDSIDENHIYGLLGNQHVRFMKKVDGKLVYDGTTNEELLEVLIHRVQGLNNKFPCMENMNAIAQMGMALEWLKSRTTKRIKQNVEGQDIAHVS